MGKRYAKRVGVLCAALLVLALPAVFSSEFAQGAPRRRQLLLLGLGAPAAAAQNPRQLLLDTLLRQVDVQSLSFPGAPATSATVSAETAQAVMALADELESSFPRQSLRKLLQDPRLLAELGGCWRLLYTDAPEITGLANLPLGLALGPVYQLINVSSRAFENEALVTHKLGLVKADLRVVGAFAPAPLGSLNAAGRKNQEGNRGAAAILRTLLGPHIGCLGELMAPESTWDGGW
ncbi:unnamed protein product [Effrenium voratum]|nr:unnamed protein product [Effrenium voratum]CAJ1459180.1 unnamed protein product [Effrenium voratum]